MVLKVHEIRKKKINKYNYLITVMYLSRHLNRMKITVYQNVIRNDDNSKTKSEFSKTKISFYK